MKFFNRKPKAHLDEFCRDFYDRTFRSNIGGSNVGSIFLDTVRQAVIEADSSFASGVML